MTEVARGATTGVLHSTKRSDALHGTQSRLEANTTMPDSTLPATLPPFADFYRLRRLPPYVFGEVNKLKAAARAAGRDVIDFGMGNPDMPTPPHIVEKLIEAVQNPRTHRYSTSRGIPGLRRAIAGYYARRFGVDLDPETEILPTGGSKEAIFLLPLAFLDARSTRNVAVSKGNLGSRDSTVTSPSGTSSGVGTPGFKVTSWPLTPTRYALLAPLTK